MRIYLVVAILLCVQLSYVVAQNRSFATLPLVQSANIVGSFEDDLNHTADYDHILKIYNDLVQARGDLRYPVPKLALRDIEGYVASMNYDENEITIEKKAYDIVKQFGDAGVAFLLAHELTHYYEKHAWSDFFIEENRSIGRRNDTTSIIRRIQDVKDGVIHETEADYLGGFLAYTAGYGLFERGDSLISKLYHAYGLNDTLALYPTRMERIELSKRSAKKLGLLVDAFEMANFLYATGQHALAYRYYEYILKHYQSRELYNNLGTISVLTAMEVIGEDKLKYKYVSVMDLDAQGSKDVSRPITEVVAEALDQAILHFNAAINLDPNYAPAYLNKANAYALKKEWIKASFYLEQEALPKALASPNKYRKTIQDITVLQGIIAAETGDSTKAQRLLEEATAAGSALGAQNLAIHTGASIDQRQGSAVLGEVSAETIGGLRLNKKFFRSPPYDQSKIVSVDRNSTFFQADFVTNKVKVFLNRDDDARWYTALLMTNPGYDGSTSNGIKLGDLRQDIFAKMGHPKRTIETTKGQVLVYDFISFVLEDDHLLQWVLVSGSKLY